MKNVIALIWDFDKTLIKGYMQGPIFKRYNVDAVQFWKEVNAMPEEYKKKNIKVNKDTCYLVRFIREAKPGGLFEGLSNKMLREDFGVQQEYYLGIPEIFETTKQLLLGDKECEEYDISVEHYIVSTGFAEVIKGTILKDYVEDIWGCELIENEEDPERPYIAEQAFTIDNTTKTRALFEINKGLNKNPDADVNTKMTTEQRRVDFRNMIYIADGPSDVPAFSVVKKNGGATFAIYPRGDKKALSQVEQLRKDNRIDMYAEADYSEDSMAYMWLCMKIKEFAERIKHEEKAKLAYGHGPQHLVDK